MILLVGNKGNMARRYSAILDYLKVQYTGIDQGDEIPPGEFDSIIICTPTEDHYQRIMYFKDWDCPILCEKPIVKDKAQLKNLLSMDTTLAMVNQYKHMKLESTAGQTYYDYWNSGKDGPEWDCINIIGLAFETPSIMNYSPIWKCSINDNKLSIRNMDYAYIKMIEQWVKRPTGNKTYIEKAHKRVFDGRYFLD